MKVLLILISSALLILGCERKVNGIFYISNNSEDQSRIPLRIIIDNDTIFNQYTEYTNIRPDTKYTMNWKVSKGKHNIQFEVSNSELRKIDTVDFKSDRWIFLTYDYKAPADSIEKSRLDEMFIGIPKTDSSISNLYNGRRPCLSIYVMDKIPQLL